MEERNEDVKMSAHNKSDLLDFWGKTGDDDTIHPALLHMVDVGQVAATLLEKAASRALLEFLSEPFGRDTDFVLRLISFIAACHDIGKISPGFQNKRPDLTTEFRDKGFRFSKLDEANHCRVAQQVLPDLLKSNGATNSTAKRLSELLGAHHGRFLMPSSDGTAGCGRNGWNDARIRALNELGRLFKCNRLGVLQGVDSLSSAWSMVAAGVVTVSDWIGSSKELFPYANRSTLSIDEYAEESRRRAERAMERLGWIDWSASGHALGFTDLFPDLIPNEMQSAGETAASQTEAPALFLIEAPMGLGKTEAALAIAEDHLQRFSMSGIYYALPTQATSNQMFERLRNFLQRRYAGLKVDLHLLHGLSDLSESYRELRLAAVSQDDQDRGQYSTVQASSWFSARKRGLLAPFGVGTIDQVLLSVLNTPHMFVRLFGLGQKVVILDEVHAYDTYMSTLLDRLIGWLSALHTTVIVLSATLPKQRRQQILSAYNGAVTLPNYKSYPTVISLPRSGNATIASPSVERTSTIALEYITESDWIANDIAALFSRRLERGGCAVWICNTVARAQQMYQVIRESLRRFGIDTHLLHARFPVHRRIALENDLLAKFGKGTNKRPKRAVLVATQVVEQSLDLDFDLMVSDLAPLDLLLQRAGRLHRHYSRIRPSGLSVPTLVWIAPVEVDGVPDLGVNAKVYDEYVLLRSWLVLRSHQSLNVPDDVTNIIESVYGDNEITVDDRLSNKLSKAREVLLSERERSAHKADRVDLPPPTANQLYNRDLIWLEEDKPDIHETLQARTRLTRPSVTIVCAHRDGSGLILDNGDRLDPEQVPDSALIRSIRLSCVSIQRWDWVKRFLKQKPPVSWLKSGLLSNCKLAEFEQGVLQDTDLDTELLLSSEIGLVVRDSDEK